ncbi:prephenate dehydrogenase [Ruania halotolerans]|uniref:prephenate dehydrogenase n=1 Tax=Ruania halotolerans TaxID=2897773 RepID=UPI001E38C3D0|nr:prephenate dehydrogenase [Ruania halotolerans]UFU08154.1 prephenate dehydrogenase [Ruania halotolerans]
MTADDPTATRGPVHIVGTGLLGTSIALALTARGVSVTLADTSPSMLALARDLGAGTIARADANTASDTGPTPSAAGDAPALVVVAVPPDVTADEVAHALRRFPDAVVTDVASVKSVLLAELHELAAGDPRVELSRYVGSHPMAGREKSGAAAASADLFIGRPWVLAAHEDASERAILTVRALAADAGASLVSMDADEHDDAVALISHVPQLMASLMAAQLVDAPERALALAGQGVRDVTRIAASEPRLWSAILTGNAAAVSPLLRTIRDDLDALVRAIDRAAAEGPLAPGAVAGISRLIAAGNDGVARVPGKHGGARRRYAEVTVLVPDEPGELGRLFSEVGEIGVNIEDFQMEHSPKQKVGMAIVSVTQEAAQPLEQALEQRGWRVVAP